MMRNVSAYVPMPDGVRIAVDAWMPGGAGPDDQVPTIVEFTRYWRATEGEDAPPRASAFAELGFAYAIVDCRGSGASFGVREAEPSTTEVRDFPHVIEWLAEQAWSNGAVATTGVSYAGNTAEYAMIGAPPALQATVPRFTDFDLYSCLLFPGGLPHRGFLHPWSVKVRALDLNDARTLEEIDGPTESSSPRSVKPVATDTDRTLLGQAVMEHRQNVFAETGMDSQVFRDDAKVAASLKDPGDHLVMASRFQDDSRLGEIPSFHWASFSDAGTAAGAIARFQGSRAPMKVVIGYWTHGAYGDANPYATGEREVAPSIPEQFRMMADFLEPLKSHSRADKSVGRPVLTPGERAIHYFTAGQNAWKETATWPPPGTVTTRLYFSAGGALASEVRDGPAVDQYTVDFEAGTGSFTRWSTQRGGSAVDYGDRAEPDKRLLTYTSEPLEADTEITGTPLIRLVMASSQTDGAIIAYLEDVAPDGRATMLTEGQLRLVHRRVSTDAPPYPLPGPYHTFERKDAQPMVPGEFADIGFALLPLSVEVKRGHRLRVALAGHDKDNFDRIPCDAPPVYSLRRDHSEASVIDLPIVRGADVPDRGPGLP